MRAASPPASAAEIIESGAAGRRSRARLSKMGKQNSLDDCGLDLEEEGDDYDETDSGIEGGFGRDSPRPDTPVVEKGVARWINWEQKSLSLNLSLNL